MECKECLERLPAYVLDELATDERRDLREHVSACTACRSELEAMGGVIQDLHRIPVPQGSAERRERTLLAMSRAAAGEPPQKGVDLLRRLGRKPGFVAAAALLMMCVYAIGHVSATFVPNDSPVLATLGPAVGKIWTRTRATADWEQPRTSAPIHAGEPIQTRLNSYALLRIDGGGTIEIDEETAVSLSADDGTTYLTLTSGAVFCSADNAARSRLSVSTPEGRVEAADGQFEVVYSLDQHNRAYLMVRVAAGEVLLVRNGVTSPLPIARNVFIRADGTMVETAPEEGQQIASWRSRRADQVNPGILPPSMQDTRIPVPDLQVRVVGKNPDGSEILEYFIPNTTFQVDRESGETVVAVIESEDAVRANDGTDEIVIPIRFRLKKNNN
jgi:hypothetical protein